MTIYTHFPPFSPSDNPPVYMDFFGVCMDEKGKRLHVVGIIPGQTK